MTTAPACSSSPAIRFRVANGSLQVSALGGPTMKSHQAPNTYFSVQIGSSIESAFGEDNPGLAGRFQEGLDTTGVAYATMLL